MKRYKFKAILQATGWVDDAKVSVNDDGLIMQISSAGSTDDAEIIDAFAIPGFQNAHSHAFQYAMAGLTESHASDSGTPDDFWSWREAMYQLALHVNPDQMQAIATMVYAEMARLGYTNVAEFHYLHHDPSGRPYDNLAEMGSRLVAAAQTVGIGITLIPIFYQKGGFGLPANDGQRRFLSASIDDYLSLYESSQAACQHYSRASSAIGVHSMRAVEPLDIVRLAEQGPQDVPFHMHVSEQLKEVADSIHYLGQRPVEWLLDHAELSARFHLVHATHLTEQETTGLAHSGAHVVLCPSTEGNLGDGLFPLSTYQAAGGQWSIGTDSHIGINPLEELRILDYGQRVSTHKRNIFYHPDQTDSGAYAIHMALSAGRKAMGNQSDTYLSIGDPANMCLLNAQTPLLSTASAQNRLSTAVYAADASMLLPSIAYGKQTLTDGKYQDICRKFVKTMTELKNR